MQVNATLIAAQQAAREAQARFQTAHVARPAVANFAAAMDDEIFKPLPLKQGAAPETQAAATPVANSVANPVPAMRPGSRLDIKI